MKGYIFSSEFAVCTLSNMNMMSTYICHSNYLVEHFNGSYIHVHVTEIKNW